MPPKHRQFLEMLGVDNYNINHFVKKLTSSEQVQQESELLHAYNACIDQLVTFRNRHIQIVTLYILAQIRKNDYVQSDSKKQIDHPVNSNSKHSDERSSARGTGGTVLMPFLKTCRDETIIQRLH
ncbi:unnamed protein product [Rotaria magnacalcarata]|nr:unnamed protein product [Rotaria magnacalcarata]